MVFFLLSYAYDMKSCRTVVHIDNVYEVVVNSTVYHRTQYVSGSLNMCDLVPNELATIR